MNRLSLACATGLAAVTLIAAPVALAGPAVAAPALAPAAARPTLSAKATVGTVKAWQQFRVYGVAHNIKAGTRVTLQQVQGKRWVSLPVHMNTNRDSTYNLRVELGIKGRNQLRIVGGGAVSNVVTVTVR